MNGSRSDRPSAVDAHRPAKGYPLAAILSVHQPRTVANDYTVQYEGRRLQIERRSVTAGLRGGRVLIEKRLDGSLRLRFRDRYLRWHQTPPAAPKVASAPTRPRRRGEAASGPPPGPPAASPDHPWRKPFKRTLSLCTKPDISTLR